MNVAVKKRKSKKKKKRKNAIFFGSSIAIMIYFFKEFQYIFRYLVKKPFDLYYARKYFFDEMQKFLRF